MFALLSKIGRKIKTIIWNLLSAESAWLYKNRTERMDTNRLDIFEPSRAAFHLDRYNFAIKFVKGKEEKKIMISRVV